MSDTIETAVKLGRALLESEVERNRTLAVLDLTAAQRDKFVAEWGRLRAGIEALADEWDAKGANLLAEADAYRRGSRTRAVLDAHASTRRAVSHDLRALLHDDIESEA